MVISKSIEMMDIVKILKKGEKSVVYQGASKHLLVDSMPAGCDQQPAHQRDRGIPSAVGKIEHSDDNWEERET